MPGCGSQRLLRCRLHPAGRGPNSSSLFPPLAAVVAVAPKGRAFYMEKEADSHLPLFPCTYRFALAVFFRMMSHEGI